ncbi:MAG: alpha/beta fold hydrolase [Bacteroidia bacterium]|nr:alpha/beta fold hydrolase [Bacteroidia bacterium]MDW8236434.1 alpha/beta fold hydrolase [Bacteroidia bacterium]
MLLNFERQGAHPPFYGFLHGFLGSLDNWRTIARSLALPGSYLLIDARNHGRSPHTAEMNYAVMAADLERLMDYLGIERAHWLGHSMGGKTAMYLALHAPQRVASLIVADIAPRRYTGGHERILHALQNLNLSVTRREEVEAQLTQAIPDAGIRQFLLKGLVRDAEGRFAWRMNLPVLIQEYPNILEAVEGKPYEGPVLFLRGEYSSYIGEEDEEEIHRLFPRVQFRTVPRAGHWLHVDNPAAVLEEVGAFWQAVAIG